MLRFDRVSFSYRTETATISDVSFEIGEGEFVALLGENGAGKSTLLRLCNGLLRPTSGRVSVRGYDTATTKTSAIARFTGFLFQNPDRQICQNTVYGEIMFGLEYILPDESERRRRTDETLALFSLDGLGDPFGLSRGERQQIALAAILARKPVLLLLDEPTTGLDYRECMTVMEIVSNLNAEGTTVFMISHDMEVVADFARRVLVLSGGRLIGDGPVRRIMKDPGVLREASLLPAQIPALAMTLGDSFANIFTIDEMADTVGQRALARQTSVGKTS
ncbi:MAG: energy-coupling factor ABC transporter ATP-binding protein [Synergistaceae bacterium]|jgi:energy-coupling factor transport system ATP-binding protein|nr:energy-coupling factor ABC transporter ATP-binding protein [Synergistaceae bacterium]